ncbi:hypothetical protein Cob_v011154 [Colletotrichum orbiculare MAFF 240422]|uniref:Uncharacterized protein n=1 Tax=Colletotrichum orbiculare (strain 104-T / ATCC 96160 / CBS 514.97 / LARS 414 / MAFF 240422) TaxID=1213857 RepID=A0A484FBN9_COLOR|nr:hypothetical protein Cob_v011154 [Colletotrichum orbiculare MAFF 240422]
MPRTHTTSSRRHLRLQRLRLHLHFAGVGGLLPSTQHQMLMPLRENGHLRYDRPKPARGTSQKQTTPKLPCSIWALRQSTNKGQDTHKYVNTADAVSQHALKTPVCPSQGRKSAAAILLVPRRPHNQHLSKLCLRFDYIRMRYGYTALLCVENTHIH